MTSVSTSLLSTSASFLECPICQQSLLLEHLYQCQPNSQQKAADNSTASTDDSLEVEDWSPICTPCGHMFHRACITEWFRIRQSYDGEGGSQNRCYCPSCRKTIAYQKLVRVFLPIIPAYEDDDKNNMSVSLRPMSSNISVSESVRQYSEQHYNMTMNRGYGSNGSRIYNDLFAISSRRFSQNFDQNQVVHGGDADSTYRRHNPYHYGYLRNRQIGDQHQGYRHRNHGADNAVIDSDNVAADVTTTIPHCENADCVALKNVLDLLSRELTWTQRKLEVEVDISKMKSILVRGLQKDVDLLRKIRRGPPPPNASKIIWILLISFFFFWITACLCAVLF